MLTVFVNSNKVDHTSLSFSSVDPGGFEACSFVPANSGNFSPGDEVRVFEGVETAWHGHIDEPGVEIGFGRISNQVNAVGYGADLRSQPYAMVFVDSDSSTWSGSTLERKQAVKVSTYQSFDGNVDVSQNGLPGPHVSFAGAWAAVRPLSELWKFSLSAPYRRMYSDWTLGSWINIGDANWRSFVLFQDAAASVNLASVSILSATSGTFALETPIPAPLLVFQLIYDAGTAGTEGAVYEAWLTNTTLYGDHALTVRSQVASSGTTVHGLYLSDIVDEIVRLSGTRFDRQIEASDYLVTQAAYGSPTAADVMLEDMRKLSGWHWGVWEPGSLSRRPTFMFRKPPLEASVSVGTTDCNALDITESLSALYNEIYLSYTNGYGTQSYVPYANPHPRIRPGEVRRLVVDGGNLTDEAAAVFARYVLLLTQADSRVTGSCELPMKTREGKWAHLIRPGREKIRIIDLPIASRSLVGDNNSRVDTFRISRVSVSVDQTGIPKTSVEFDRGADLIEVLQARQTQGNARIGF